MSTAFKLTRRVVIPWEDLDETPVPGTKSKLTLHRRGDEYVIRVDRKDLMSSRVTGSEIALAELARDALGHAEGRVLIGGLGMGFTLRATLDSFIGDVIVAELVQGVVTWNEGVLASLHGDALADPRVTVHVGDVRDRIEASGAGFDAILLDVDNGPDGLTRDSNAWLYESRGLAAAKRALRKGGVLAVWSAFDDPRFTRRLEKAGFDVRVQAVRARGKKGARHTIWLARKA